MRHHSPSTAEGPQSTDCRSGRRDLTQPLPEAHIQLPPAYVRWMNFVDLTRLPLHMTCLASADLAEATGLNVGGKWPPPGRAGAAPTAGGAPCRARETQASPRLSRSGPPGTELRVRPGRPSRDALDGMSACRGRASTRMRRTPGWGRAAHDPNGGGGATVDGGRRAGGCRGTATRPGAPRWPRGDPEALSGLGLNFSTGPCS